MPARTMFTAHHLTTLSKIVLTNRTQSITTNTRRGEGLLMSSPLHRLQRGDRVARGRIAANARCQPD